MFFRDKNNKCPNVLGAIKLQENTVTDAFDNKTWYCHKQILTPSYQPKDMTNVTAHYELDKHNVVHITNCGIRANGQKECVGFLRGTLPKGETKAKFVVKPWFVPGFLVRKTNYWIVDQTKERMIVSAGIPTILEPNCMRRPAEGQGLWIMTNDKIRNDCLIENAVSKLEDYGINCVDMKWIEHK
jgi:hypothetical protein